MKKSITMILALSMLLVPGMGAYAIHEEIPAETQPPETPPVTLPAQVTQPAQDSYTLKALINLLEREGVITRKDLTEEIERLRKGK